MGGSNVKDSSLFTGAGTPWSAENKNTPMTYANLALSDPLANLTSTVHNDVVSPLIRQMGFEPHGSLSGAAKESLGLELDTQGNERANIQRDAQMGNDASIFQGQQQEAERARQNAERAAQLGVKRQEQSDVFGGQMAAAEGQTGAMDAMRQARRAAQASKGRRLFGG